MPTDPPTPPPIADEPDAPAPPVAAGRAFTPRALIVGVGLCAVFAALTPFNDWVVGNTYLYCHYLPPGVLLALLVLVLGVNPLLGARRLRAGELAVIAALLFALGGVVSNGFARLWTQMTTRPARHLPTRDDLPALTPRDAPVRLPQGFFLGIPGDRPIDANDPEHRVVIDGFYEGLPDAERVEHRAIVTWRDAAGVVRTQPALGGATARAAPPGTFLDLDGDPGRALRSLRVGEGADGATVLAVEPPAIPWDAWTPVFLRWLPMLAGMIVASLAIAALVRDQWSRHERLPYPIAGFLYGFIEDPAPGRRLPPLLTTRGFWVGALIAGVILGSQGLEAFGLLPVSIPTSLDLTRALATDWTMKMWLWWEFLRPRAYLSIIALTFFLPLNLSFSLWFFYVATQIGYAVARSHGIEMRADDAAKAGVGGYAIECLLILWIGRGYYWRVLRAALPGRADPLLRELAPYVWALLLGIAAMAGSLVAAGARLDHALLATLLLLMFVLVMARIVAEAGISFVQVPTSHFISQIVFTATGFAAPIAALAPLTLIGIGLFSDSREHLLPYAVQAENLAQRAGAPRRRLSLAMLLVALGGAAAGVAIMVWIYYRCEHVEDTWPHNTLFGDNLLPLANGVEAGGDADRGRTIGAYAFGAGLVGVVGIGRLLFAWWPLHPLGVLVVPAWATHTIWCSFLIGWFLKLLVMRYGGVAVYRGLKPVAAGLIAGEAVLTVLFLLLGMGRWLMGLSAVGLPRFLPS